MMVGALVALVVTAGVGGISTNWESGPGGKIYYTMRLEETMMRPLHDGHAIVVDVQNDHRGLKRFQIVPDKSGRKDSTRARVMKVNVSTHGWRPRQEGGMEYMIQLSSDHLKSLSDGNRIVGQFVSEVTDKHPGGSFMRL